MRTLAVLLMLGVSSAWADERPLPIAERPLPIIADKPAPTLADLPTISFKIEQPKPAAPAVQQFPFGGTTTARFGSAGASATGRSTISPAQVRFVAPTFTNARSAAGAGITNCVG